jgi:estrogen-related receptor beta like 1
MEDDGNLSG